MKHRRKRTPKGRNRKSQRRAVAFQLSKPAVANDRVRSACGRLVSATWTEFEEIATRWADAVGIFLDRASRRRIFDPLMTFILFLRQMMPDRPATRTVVADHARRLEIRSGKRISLNNSAYCQARGRLKKGKIMEYFDALTKSIRERAGLDALRWRDRDVQVVDGTCLTLPDTPANRKVFPLAKPARPGCGFPKMRMLAVFSLTTGAVMRYLTGSYARSELSLFNEVMDSFRPGDVMLADRGFCSWSHIVALMRREVDTVVRLKESRTRRRVLKTLGRGDRIVAWLRPDRRPEWMNAAAWREMPEELFVREIECAEHRPGARTRKVRIATTLLDPKKYPARAFGDLYRMRWDAELYLRDLKTTLGLEHLTSQTPEMAEKEIATCMCGYDIVRGLMLLAATWRGMPVRDLSFLRSADEFKMSMHYGRFHRDAQDDDPPDALLEQMIRRIGCMTKTNGGARRKAQPRAIKKRKKYPYLTSPRGSYREIPHRNHAYRRNARSSEGAVAG